MAKRIGSCRRKTRQLLKKSSANRGKISLKTYFQNLKQGEKVKLVAEPGVQKGTFHYRFYGKVGIIQNKKGSCYAVKINDGKKQKLLIVNPIHLKKV